jgi:hypothetical protein
LFHYLEAIMKAPNEHRILLIEDDARIATRLREAIAALPGVVVSSTWIVGVRDAQPENGVLKGIDVAGLDVGVNLSDFSIAFCDGQLIKGSPTGPAIVPYLVQAGITCIAMSNAPGVQQAMVQAGARPVDKLTLGDFVLNELPKLL